MCGIAGYWDTRRRSSTEQLQTVVTQMRDTLVHRGPDGAGSWVDANIGVAFGHRRLAILDLTASGQQPMVSNSKRYVITFNGEIYNFKEINPKYLIGMSVPPVMTAQIANQIWIQWLSKIKTKTT